jgi:integrase/recombinase XerD
MTPLRQKMIDAMLVRGFAQRTQHSYLDAVTKLAMYYHCCPSRISKDEIQAYFLYLVKERHLSAASCRLYLNAIRFLYVKVLGNDQLVFRFDVPKRKQKIPELLTHNEVADILKATANLKWRALLALCYGCGLRVSELAVLRVSDIDGERHLLRVTQGKGHKDRSVILSAYLLEYLQRYWRMFHPCQWLFYSTNVTQSYSISSIQRAFTHAKQVAGVNKIGGIHSLRHAYATHQLAAGMPIHILKQQLGHKDIHSTLRYVHWVPNYQEGKGIDLVAKLEVCDE